MNVICFSCKALRWPGETHDICCGGGIWIPQNIPSPIPTDNYLRQLLTGD